jgi:hypothetical protein
MFILLLDVPLGFLIVRHNYHDSFLVDKLSLALPNGLKFGDLVVVLASSPEFVLHP